jgi:hypothetical protein
MGRKLERHRTQPTISTRKRVPYHIPNAAAFVGVF